MKENRNAHALVILRYQTTNLSRTPKESETLWIIRAISVAGSTSTSATERTTITIISTMISTNIKVRTDNVVVVLAVPRELAWHSEGIGLHALAGPTIYLSWRK